MSGSGPAYQAFPEGNPAKDWEIAALHLCSKKRMDHLAKEVYKIPNASKLTKEPLYHAIFDRMVQEQECARCFGNCKPDTHEFEGRRQHELGRRRLRDGQ